LMALVSATVANGGAMPAPYLVAEIRAPDGTVQRPHLPGGRLRQVLRPETAAALTSFMVLSVDEAYARAAQIPGVRWRARRARPRLSGHPPSRRRLCYNRPGRRARAPWCRRSPPSVTASGEKLMATNTPPTGPTSGSSAEEDDFEFEFDPADELEPSNEVLDVV